MASPEHPNLTRQHRVAYTLDVERGTAPGYRGGLMKQEQDHPQPLSRRTILRTAVLGTLGSAFLAACGQPAAPAPSAANTSQAPAATNPPAAAATQPTATNAPAAKPATAAAAPQSTSQAAAAQAGAGLTTDQISLLFMGHVAGGQNEQKAYDDILAEWVQQHPNIKVEYQ